MAWMDERWKAGRGMSRILVFDKDFRKAGEVHGDADCGWAISGGGSFSVTLSADEAAKKILQLGRMVMIAPKDLPVYAGVIDTPWNGSYPVKIMVYDLPYLLSWREPYHADVRTGSLSELAGRFLELAQQLGNFNIRLGNVAESGDLADYPIEQRSIWNQLQDLVKKTGTEMMFRSEIDDNNTLVHYLDIQPRLGVETSVVLQDGENANAEISDVVEDGDIRNSVLGFSNESSGASRKYSAIKMDAESISTYMLRNRVLQYKTQTQTALDAYAEAELANNSRPKISVKLKAMRRYPEDPLFNYLRLGNVISVRATRCILSGGRIGWSGQARIVAMKRLEVSNQVELTVDGVS